MAGVKGRSGPPGNQNNFKHGLAAIQKRREERITTEHEESVREQILDGLIADKGGIQQVSTATRILAEVIASDAAWLMVFNGAIDHIIQNNPKARQNPRGLSQLDGYKRGLVNSLTSALAADPTIGNRTINARAETLTELPSFKNIVDRRRCIIPADGFYEWRKEGKRKVPMWVHLKTKEPCAFAGLWDVWRKPDGERIESFTIITTEPNELVRPVHNRMPVILSREDEEQWLDDSRTPFAKAKSVLKPYPDELMDAHDVSPIVNSAKYDGPECVQPASDDEIPTGGQLSLL